jgi:hypothetical protein
MPLSPDRGGVFDVFLSLVRHGLGGTTLPGNQYVSWIHEADSSAPSNSSSSDRILPGPSTLPLPIRCRTATSCISFARHGHTHRSAHRKVDARSRHLSSAHRIRTDPQESPGCPRPPSRRWIRVLLSQVAGSRARTSHPLEEARRANVNGVGGSNPTVTSSPNLTAYTEVDSDRASKWSGRPRPEAK